jgi:hypothetical protein
MRDTQGTMEYLRRASEGPLTWKALCLMLARKARDLPAVYPSAFAAQLATPEEFRVYDRDKVKRGMVAFYDDPRDNNPFGHITTVAGFDTDDDQVDWTNDILRTGGVNKVKSSLFPSKWGDGFQFAATWLNGQPLALHKPVPDLSADKRIKHAILDLERIRDEHRGDHPRVVKALTRDIRELKETLDKFGGKK